MSLWSGLRLLGLGCLRTKRLGPGIAGLQSGVADAEPPPPPPKKKKKNLSPEALNPKNPAHTLIPFQALNPPQTLNLL